MCCWWCSSWQPLVLPKTPAHTKDLFREQLVNVYQLGKTHLIWSPRHESYEKHFFRKSFFHHTSSSISLPTIPVPQVFVWFYFRIYFTYNPSKRKVYLWAYSYSATLYKIFRETNFFTFQNFIIYYTVYYSTFHVLRVRCNCSLALTVIPAWH